MHKLGFVERKPSPLERCPSAHTGAERASSDSGTKPLGHPLSQKSVPKSQGGFTAKQPDKLKFAPPSRTKKLPQCGSFCSFQISVFQIPQLLQVSSRQMPVCGIIVVPQLEPRHVDLLHRVGGKEHKGRLRAVRGDEPHRPIAAGDLRKIIAAAP